MPRLIIQIDETIEADGEDRMISGFAFQVHMEPLANDTDQTETVLPDLLPLFFGAIKAALDANFGAPVTSLIAPIPPDGVDPLPTLNTLIEDYRARKDSFPADLEV